MQLCHLTLNVHGEQKPSIPDICHPYPWPGKDCRVGRSPTRSSLTCRSPKKLLLLGVLSTPIADVLATSRDRSARFEAGNN